MQGWPEAMTSQPGAADLQHGSLLPVVYNSIIESRTHLISHANPRDVNGNVLK
jgi:hypothetical protein